ncbi:hypothetical protein AU510_07030 [Lonsdalea britannica]|nr:hypothetical protein AU510_07030 [Lonsdalea britannica]
MYNQLKMLRSVILLVGFCVAVNTPAQDRPLFSVERGVQPPPAVTLSAVYLASRDARPIDWRKYMSVKIKPVALYRNVHFPPESMALAIRISKESIYNGLPCGAQPSSTRGFL